MKKRSIRLNIIFKRLLKKKVLILLYKKNELKRFIFFYYFFLIINYFKYFFFQKKLTQWGLKYFYLLKLITYDRYFLNLKINSILENMYFLNIFNEGNVLTFLKKSNIFFSVVRSPFVYKKSMEQFFLQKFKGTFMSNKFCYNFFLQVYEEEQLKNKLKEEVILKYCYKLVLDSSKNNETI